MYASYKGSFSRNMINHSGLPFSIVILYKKKLLDE